MSEPQCDRYALVKLRSRIAESIRTDPKVGYRRMYRKFCENRWMPSKRNGELLDLQGLQLQYKKVKSDINHNVSDFSIRFLYRAGSKIRTGRNGIVVSGAMRDVARMLGVNECTIKDVLILNGDIR